LIWAVLQSENLPERAGKLIADLDNELFFSPANLWEVAIKQKKGFQDFDIDAKVLRRELLHNDYRELPITGIHAIAVSELPSIHKDPFDRLLLAQAKSENLTLLTADEIIALYPAPILHIPKR
jgi:PIN domain nuclease of toxin-antitoxin system